MRNVWRNTSRFAGLVASVLTLVVVIAAFTRSPAATRAGVAAAAPPRGDVLRGRTSVITHDCGGCHGGFGNPAAPGWLAGVKGPDMEFKIGACYVTGEHTPSPAFPGGLYWSRFWEGTVHAVVGTCAPGNTHGGLYQCIQ